MLSEISSSCSSCRPNLFHNANKSKFSEPTSLSSFLKSICLLYILTAVSSSYFPSNSFLPSTPLPFLFRKGEASRGYQPAWIHQVAVREAHPLLLRLEEEARMEKGYQRQAIASETILLLLLRISYED